MAVSRRSVEKEAFWRLVLDEQKASGLSVRAFCRKESVSEPSFYAWRKELAKRDQDGSESESGQLIPVSVVDRTAGNVTAGNVELGSSSSCSLEVETPSGFKLRFDRQLECSTLRDFLHVVACCDGHGDEVVGGSSC